MENQLFKKYFIPSYPPTLEKAIVRTDLREFDKLLRELYGCHGYVRIDDGRSPVPIFGLDLSQPTQSVYKKNSIINQ